MKRTMDTETVGRLICTKSIGSDLLENLTQDYKSKTSKAKHIIVFKEAILC